MSFISTESSKAVASVLQSRACYWRLDSFIRSIPPSSITATWGKDEWDRLADRMILYATPVADENRPVVKLSWWKRIIVKVIKILEKAIDA